MKEIEREKKNLDRFVAHKNEYKVNIDGNTENIAEIIKKRSEQDIQLAMKKYMPIGSVVKLKESLKKYMIIGFKDIDEKELYDYLGCEFPYGVKKNAENKKFNHEDIDRVYYIGFFNEQAKSYRDELNGENER